MTIPSVLIIDDSEADRYLLERMLLRGKLTDHVFEAGDGREALDFFADEENAQRHPGRFPPTLVFLDINMPRCDGFEFLREFEAMRATGGYESVVLMMFSSSERPEDRERVLGYDFVRGYITKMPEDAEELRGILASAGVLA